MSSFLKNPLFRKSSKENEGKRKIDREKEVRVRTGGKEIGKDVTVTVT